MPQRNVEDAFRDIATSTSGNIGRLANSSESFHFRSGLLYKTLNFGIVNGLGKIQVWTYEKNMETGKESTFAILTFFTCPNILQSPFCTQSSSSAHIEEGSPSSQ